LQTLEALRKQGVLTDEEFQTARARLLNRPAAGGQIAEKRR
jgi:hypothetical protein